MPQGLSVRVRLLLIGPGAGMRVARASYPGSGLSGEIIPLLLHVCVYISGVYIGQYKVLLELYLGAVPWASGSVYACTRYALVAGHEDGRMCVLGHACPWDGWMDG